MAIKIQGDTVIYDDKVFKVGSGTTAQRPQTPTEGMIRYNTDLETFEGYSNGMWGAIGGGATGAPGNDIFWENDQTVISNYTITVGKNAGSFGPISIADGVVVTVPNGSVWTIV